MFCSEWEVLEQRKKKLAPARSKMYTDKTFLYMWKPRSHNTEIFCQSNQGNDNDKKIQGRFLVSQGEVRM